MTLTEIIYFVFLVSILSLVLIILIVLLVGAIRRLPKKSKCKDQMPIVNIYLENGKKIEAKDGTVVQTNTVVEPECPVVETKKIQPKAQPKEEVKVVEPAEKVEFKVELASKSKVVIKRYEKLIELLKGIDPKVKIKDTMYRQTVKYLTYKICNLNFARGQIKASFFVSSSEFKSFSKETGVSLVKEKPTSVVLDNDDALDVCMNLAQIAYSQAKEAISNKKKEKRR